MRKVGFNPMCRLVVKMHRMKQNKNRASFSFIKIMLNVFRWRCLICVTAYLTS